MTNSFITLNGKKILIYRGYTENEDLSATNFLPPTKFSVGIENSNPAFDAVDLDIRIPIEDGTVIDNGSNNLNWIGMGTYSTTNNTTIYKEGAGETDNTGQNLLEYSSAGFNNNWELTGLSIDPDKAFGAWIYIKDSSVLDKLVYVTFGFAGLIKLNEDLKVGWNWFSTGNKTINENSTTTYGSTITSFLISFITNETGITEGDLVYDLARQWTVNDTKNDFTTGYPIFNELAGEVEIRCFLSKNQANGFPLNSFGLYNEDDEPLLHSIDVFNIESKSSTDEYIFIVKDRVI